MAEVQVLALPVPDKKMFILRLSEGSERVVGVRSFDVIRSGTCVMAYVCGGLDRE